MCRTSSDLTPWVTWSSGSLWTDESNPRCSIISLLSSNSVSVLKRLCQTLRVKKINTLQLCCNQYDMVDIDRKWVTNDHCTWQLWWKQDTEQIQEKLEHCCIHGKHFCFFLWELSFRKTRVGLDFVTIQNRILKLNF